LFYFTKLKFFKAKSLQVISLFIWTIVKRVDWSRFQQVGTNYSRLMQLTDWKYCNKQTFKAYIYTWLFVMMNEYLHVIICHDEWWSVKGIRISLSGLWKTITISERFCWAKNLKSLGYCKIRLQCFDSSRSHEIQGAVGGEIDEEAGFLGYVVNRRFEGV